VPVYRLGYRLEDRGSVPSRVSDGKFSLRHRVQTGSGVRPTSYPMGNGGSFHGGKATGREANHSSPSVAEVNNAWSYTPTTKWVSCRGA